MPMPSLLQADAMHIPLADGSVHCCVTSPPYWGLRKYAGDQGDEPLGLEATPERHIERMVDVFREVRRVLRDDGVVWLNYGDCYDANRAYQVPDNKHTDVGNSRGMTATFGPGNLMLMPHRLAIALQADGWIVRQDLVWAKPNPMPESVAGWRWEHPRTDPEGDDEWEHGYDLDEVVLRRSSWRHTRAHEYVFQLTKKMGYWSNQEAVREAAEYADGRSRRAGSTSETILTPNPNDGREFVGGRAGTPPSGRNPRSVLSIPTAPYSGAHYATFPPNLIAPLIRATCPRWACPVCGSGWAPVVEKGEPEARPDNPNEVMPYRADSGHTNGTGATTLHKQRANAVTDYRPTCEHPHTQDEAVPGIVFDPFVGSGTSVMVAQELLRRGIGMDISLPYLDEQARIRVGMGGGKVDDLPLFKESET
jgi:DNA modification methylase